MPQVILVFGLSAAGKTWLCSRFVERNAFVHVSASALLRRAADVFPGESTTSEKLRSGPILDNQRVLVAEFERLRASEQRPILFDGHNVVDDGTRLVEIPLAVVRQLHPNGIVFVRAETKDICERRARDTSRTRPLRTEETLGEHQEIALALAHSHAAELHIRLHVVQAGDEAAFSSAILEGYSPAR